MKRLTKKINGVWDVPFRDENGKFISTPRVIARLAAYEDTGLEPEEIRELDYLRRREEEAIPAADVVEVRHGRWVVSRTDFGWNCAEFPTHCKCTLCGREVPYQDRDNYCPNCGAKMDGGADSGGA